MAAHKSSRGGEQSKLPRPQNIIARTFPPHLFNNSLSLLPQKTKMSDSNNIPPTTTSYVIATAILAGVTGYFVGQGSSLRLFSSNEKEGWPNSYNVKVHRDSSDEEFEDEEEEEEDSEEEEQGELANFDNNNEEVKLVLVIRTDLGMTKGTHYLPLPLN